MTQPTATYLRTDDVPVSKLKAFEGNAKRGDVDVILDSLRRNGQYRSLIVREVKRGQLVVLAGNHTADAFRAHGPGDCGQLVTAGTETRPCGICGNDPSWKPVPRCEIVTCDDDTATRINLVDNRSAEVGSYDEKALAELLSGLDDLDGTAYNDEDLDELLKASGSLGETAGSFLATFTAPDPEPAPAAPVPTGAPALNPFSAAETPTGAPQTASTATLTAPAPDGEQQAAQDPATPPAYSPGVHTGPEAYSGPGARVHPGEPIALPESPQMVPLQWVFTLEQRDTVRGAIKAAQAAGGYETAAQALTAICAAYTATTTASEDQ